MKQLFPFTAILLVYTGSFAQMNHGVKQMQGNMPDVNSHPHSLHTVRYDLFIRDTIVKYTGKRRKAMAINGSIPAPTLYFTEGDTAEIYVHNNMKMESSIHWHGIILPNRYDGVSYLTTSPVGPGETHLYKFPIVQNGTYWYHSHTMFQQQSGIYGAFIIRKKEKALMKEFTALISDWTNERPSEVDRSLHNANDWYGIKKGSTQNYFDAIKEGYLKTKVVNEWKRMLPMDVSDVYYNRFFINGQPELANTSFKAGEKVKLRIINGSSSSYFWLQYAGGKITVVANDGKDVQPVEVDRMIIAVAETYDIIITIPANGSYELRATAEDRTKYTSLYLGEGTKVQAPLLPKLNYFEGMKMMNYMMTANGKMKDMGMQMSNQSMDMNMVMYPETNEGKKIVALNYGMLRSTHKTTLPKGPTRVLRFNLTGNMNRYIWSIDNKTVSEADTILIHKGENVRIILYNGTMMRHPMHLHGHFFRVINGQGDYSPLKNTLDIMPMETDTLEFAATESGNWFFHCHILYHMMSGMGRIFTYQDSITNPEVPDLKMALKMIYMDDRRMHLGAKVGLESNSSDGEVTLANTRYSLQTEWRLGTDPYKGYENEGHFGRYIGQMQFLFPYVGWDIRYRRNHGTEQNLLGQTDTKDQRAVFTAGFHYILPMLLVADARIDMKGNVRLQISREDISLSNRLRFSFMVNTDREYMAGLRYIVTKYFSISTHYDSDMGYGAGVTLSY